MSSANHANYSKIGFAIVAGLVATVVALVWLGGIRGSRHAVLVETYYDRAVSGLSVGSPVNFRGVKIGEVRELDFVGNRYKVKGDDNLRIYILMALDSRKLSYFADEGISVEDAIHHLVRSRGLYATVTPSGITGLSRIECNLSGRGMAEETYSWTPAHPVVPRKISLMDNFSDAATRIVNQVNAMDLVSVWSNVSSSVESLADTMNTVSKSVENCRGDVEKVVERAVEAAEDLRGFASEVRANPASLLHDHQPQPLDETR